MDDEEERGLFFRWLFLIPLLSCNSPEGVRSHVLPAWAVGVIYGEDDRIEPGNFVSSAEAGYVAATGGLFLRSDLLERTEYWFSKRKSLGEHYQLCSDERYFDQQLGPRCTVVLVAPDLVLTAGHCVPQVESCSEDLIVSFAYQISATQKQSPSLPAGSLYPCKKLIYRSENFREDFALLQLARPVHGIDPIDLGMTALARQSSIPETFSMVGHPLGLPKKLVRHGRLRKRNRFSSTLEIDSFSANSGSPVFDPLTGEFYALLSKGEGDLEKDESRGCYRSRRCTSDECSGEVAFHVEPIAELVEEYLQNKEGRGNASAGKGRPHIYSSFVLHEIPDADSQGVVARLRVDETPQSRRVAIGVDIEHSWVADLRIYLRPPQGGRILLRNLEPSEGNYLRGLFGVNLVSAHSLQQLQNWPHTGEWQLTVIDSTPGDTGRLLNWRVVFY